MCMLAYGYFGHFTGFSHFLMCRGLGKIFWNLNTHLLMVKERKKEATNDYIYSVKMGERFTHIFWRKRGKRVTKLLLYIYIHHYGRTGEAGFNSSNH